MNVTCCKIEADPIVATCGQGESCVAQCRASEGTLCPSGDCGNCLTFQEQPDEEEEDGELGRKRCTACQSSSSLRWCKRRGCNVGKHPICCFHPDCKHKRQNKCAYLSYFWGEFLKIRLMFRAWQVHLVLDLEGFPMESGPALFSRFLFRTHSTRRPERLRHILVNLSQRSLLI